MNTVICLTLPVMVLFTVVWQAKASTDAVEPDIRFEDGTIDFGVFTSRSYSDQKDVLLVNRGPRNYEIDSVWAGCGCITGKVSGPAVLKSGEKVKINLSLSGEKAMVGKHQYKVQVLPKNRDQPVIEGAVRYEYRPGFLLTNDVFSIHGRVDKPGSEGAVASASITLRDYSEEQSFDIQRIESSNPFLEFSVHRISYSYQNRPVNHHFVIRAILAPGWPIGKIDEKLTLYTNDPDRAVIELPVKGEITGPVRVTPGTILLRGLKPGISFERKVVLESDDDIVLGSFTASDPSMAIEIIEEESSDRKVVLLIKSMLDDEAYNHASRYWEAAYIEILRPMRYIQPIRVWGQITH